MSFPTLQEVLTQKANYSIQNKWTPFYSGGQILPLKDNFICRCGDQLKIMSYETGLTINTINLDGDDVTAFYVTSDNKSIISATRSLLLKQWDIETLTCVRTWKSIHTSPILCLDDEKTSTLLATGGSDGSVKIWDLINKYCTHNLRFPTSVVNAVKFHPSQMLLITASMDYLIRIWDLNNSKTIRVLNGHVSMITCLNFVDEDVLMSSGKDKVINFYKGFEKVSKMDSNPSKTIPTYESVESLILLPKDNPKDDLRVMIGGNTGSLSIWNTSSGCCEKKSEKISDKVEIEILQAQLFSQHQQVVVSYSDHSIEFICIKSLEVQKRLAGEVSEVTGVYLMGKNLNMIAVLMNSANIKLFRCGTSTYQLLKGHNNFVTEIAVFNDGMGFVSSDKDGFVCLWFIDEDTDDITLGIKGQTHNTSVISLAMSQLKSKYFLTGGSDCTLKTWRCVKLKKSGLKLKCDKTQAAHSQAVNTIHVSPNDKLVVTGSQDKTVKLWTFPELEPVHTYTGHKNSIWCVQFSPVDKVFASSSADGCIKIWGIDNLSCVRTIEAHDTSALSVNFLKKGTQLVSSASDGLIKFWDVKTSECLLTLDEHENNVWGLSITPDGSKMISGSGDGTFIHWEDTTDEVREEDMKKYEESVKSNEELQNLLQEKQITKALKLAIRLEQPATALKIMKEMNCDKETIEKALGTLSPTKATVLLNFVSVWNTNSKNCHQAQVLLEYLLSNFTVEEILAFDDVQSNIRGLLAYTERHYNRLSKFQQQATFIDYTLHRMKLNP